MNHTQEFLRTHPWACSAVDWACGVAIGAMLLAAGNAWSMERGDRAVARTQAQTGAEHRQAVDQRHDQRHRGARGCQVACRTRGAAAIPPGGGFAGRTRNDGNVHDEGGGTRFAGVAL